jgi:hypothetical protein
MRARRDAGRTCAAEIMAPTCDTADRRHIGARPDRVT